MGSDDRCLIVVTYHYPPDGFVGGLRWAGLTRYLAERGWRCWVVTASCGESEDVPGVTVRRIPRRTTLNDLYVRWRPRGQSAPVSASAAQPSPTDAEPAWRRWLTKLRLELSHALSVPDEARGWVWRATRATRELIEQHRPSVVVTSGPPHSVHIAGWLAARNSSARWVADFRDPWAGPIPGTAWRRHRHARSYLGRATRRYLERVVIRRADAMICNTKEMVDFFAQRYPGLHAAWLPNGVDAAALPPRSEERYAGFALAYAGTVYGGRDLIPILDGYQRFLDSADNEARTGSVLRIAGHVEPGDLAKLQDAASSRGLQDRVQYLGVLPRAAAIRLASRSHLALVLAQEQDLQAPAKLYELAGLGVATLVVGGANGAAASEATRLGFASVAAEDAEGLAAAMRAAWAGRANGSTRSAPLLFYRDLAAEAEKILARCG